MSVPDSVRVALTVRVTVTVPVTVRVDDSVGVFEGTPVGEGEDVTENVRVQVGADVSVRLAVGEAEEVVEPVALRVAETVGVFDGIVDHVRVNVVVGVIVREKVVLNVVEYVVVNVGGTGVWVVEEVRESVVVELAAGVAVRDGDGVGDTLQHGQQTMSSKKAMAQSMSSEVVRAHRVRVQPAFAQRLIVCCVHA